jgi:gas vesicle protein
MFTHKKSFLSLALFFAVGAVAGAAAALLYAPMTGRNMQRKVSDITDKLANKFSDKVDDLKVAVRRVAAA